MIVAFMNQYVAGSTRVVLLLRSDLTFVQFEQVLRLPVAFFGDGSIDIIGAAGSVDCL